MKNLKNDLLPKPARLSQTSEDVARVVAGLHVDMLHTIRVQQAILLELLEQPHRRNDPDKPCNDTR